MHFIVKYGFFCVSGYFASILVHLGGGKKPRFRLYRYTQTTLKVFVDEIIQSAALWNKYISSNTEDTKQGKEIQMLKLITSNALDIAFPNMLITLRRIYLSLMVTNCSGERSFST